MPLPAPYRNPWRNLADDLWAVVADLRLRLQELWRRNGQGTLWRPAWWPGDLAPLFWPLLLVLALSLLGAASVGAVVALRRGITPPAEPTAAPVAGGAVQTVEPEGEAELELQGEAQTIAPLVPPDLPPPAPAAAPDEPVADALPVTEAAAGEPQPPDPLAALLQRPEADGLLLAARVLPDQLSLVLEVSPRFQLLAAAEQPRRAEQWLQWAQDLGYDHLELRDPGAVLLARDALVGSGMIVLDSSSGP